MKMPWAVRNVGSNASSKHLGHSSKNDLVLPSSLLREIHTLRTVRLTSTKSTVRAETCSRFKNGSDPALEVAR